MEDFLKTIFYIALTLCLIAGTVYFTTGTYFMTKDMERSLPEITPNPVIPENTKHIADILTNNGDGLLAYHPYAWSFTLAILIFLSAISGYYTGLSTCCGSISEFFIVPLLFASVILLGALGFLIISIVTGLSAFKGLIDTTNAHIDAGLIRR